MRNLRTTERTAIETMKANMRAAKVALRKQVKDVSEFIDTAHDAGDLAEEAAAMRLRGHVFAALAELDKGHAAAMEAMLDAYTDGGVVVQGGGGGR